MMARIEARARAAAGRAVDARLRDIATALDALPGVQARVEGEAVVARGRGLLRRWLTDADVREAGR
ncbi:hypothetical protein NYR55_10930 [Sphingomonas sp. BGYR3]|uniref:hypothetical protein n=1 Tax=Sphingomonas sp. BGYR3 TaxID=2975483 RepID=UPI0021A93BAD|nr:hypothetical protein [Sphingomonas sp. BGYR3]MDG5489127.1 hypothetical protein [Sphingomonas sp. BGYR3]